MSLAALLLFSVSSFAYVTLTPSSHTVNVGEELYLNVPSATVGYIDKAVWACSNSNIAFVQKDDAGAIVKAHAYFSGAAIVELVCVEKYIWVFVRYLREGFTLTSGVISPSITPCALSKAFIFSLIKTKM